LTEYSYLFGKQALALQRILLLVFAVVAVGCFSTAELEAGDFSNFGEAEAGHGVWLSGVCCFA